MFKYLFPLDHLLPKYVEFALLNFSSDDTVIQDSEINKHESSSGVLFLSPTYCIKRVHNHRRRGGIK
jgi:hypothetical protein